MQRYHRNITKLILIMVLIIIAGYILKKNNVADIFNNAPFTKEDVIYYQEKSEKGRIVLYENSTGFRHSFYSNKLNIWNDSANAEINPVDGVSWTMINDINTPIATFAGVITNSKVKSILIKQKTIEKYAEIINVDEKLRVWYVTFDILEEGIPDPLKLEAMSDTGEILWKNGVY